MNIRDGLDQNETILSLTNGGYNSTENAGLIFTLPIWKQVIWFILYTGMVLVATGGNVIVIWIILAHRKMRTVTNYFLCEYRKTPRKGYYGK
ncbi:hypothetical protein JTB14_004761 [Gonioctena quinquepunctata]|nr:hypothetical protein JTB14_004761 [Gonioctena quinquepunctata]